MAISYWWPVLLMLVAVVWALSRILYLHIASDVKVLSFLSRPRTPQERGLAVLGLLIDAYLVLRLFYPAIDQDLYAVMFLHPIFGLLVMTIGIVLMMMCQAHMGRAWRIGVPTEREDGQKLVQSGLFRFSRNPIYLGVILFLFGALLLVPGPLTLAVFLMSAGLTHALVKSEEAFMHKTFGQEYSNYCNNVRRWF